MRSKRNPYIPVAGIGSINDVPLVRKYLCGIRDKAPCKLGMPALRLDGTRGEQLFKDYSMDTIKITLTPEQVEQLSPLFDFVEEHPMTGAILGQAWESKYFGDNYYAIFAFVTPDDIRAITDNAVAEAEQKLSQIFE